MKCKICGKDFELKKENRYVVKNVSVSGLFTRNVYESFDCPYCGCQNVVNERYLDFDEKIQCENDCEE